MKTKLVTSTIFMLLLTNMLTIAFNIVPIVLAPEDLPFELLDDIGTYFELQDVSITTNTTVHILLRASSEATDYLIENASTTTSTELTLGNLQPSTTYYMCEDSYINEKVYTTDDFGSYTYIQDLSQLHHVFIQLGRGTIFIYESTTLQSNIDGEGVQIMGDNIVLDLNGYNITGQWGLIFGVLVYPGRKNVTIKNGGVKNFMCGVYVGFHSTNNVISNNTITSNSWGGLDISVSDFNNITDNNFILNGCGVIILSASSYPSSNNRFYHNNFVDNSVSVGIYGVASNTWDNGYPSGGNYWSDYTGTDEKSGPNQDEPGSDGIGDTPYVIDGYNRDRYPVMSSWTPSSSTVSATVQRAGQPYPVLLISNSTISDIKQTTNKFYFTVTGEEGTSGYVRAMLPVGLNTTNIRIYLNKTKLTPPPYPVIVTNSTHYFIYVCFDFASAYEVAILFAPIVASVDIDPDMLNLESNGKWIAVFITLPEGYLAQDIVGSTVELIHNDFVLAADWGEIQDNILMKKFDRNVLRDYLGEVDVSVNEYYWSGVNKFYEVTLAVICELVDGTPFEGTDIIAVKAT